MADKRIPTIRPAAQARLMLYRIFSSHLGHALEQFLSAPISLWDGIIAELEQMILANSFDIPALSKAFLLMEKSTRRDLERQILRVAGEKLWLGVFPQALLENFIKEHSQLIKDVRSEHLNKIASALQRGLRQGLLPRDITKDIQALTDMSKKRARLIARNAPLQYSGELTKHHQIHAAIKKYRWQTSQDERVRESHRSKNGKVYSWDSHDPHPRSEVNCRCDAVPIIN